VEISPDVLAEGAEVLSDLVTAAMKMPTSPHSQCRTHGRTDRVGWNFRNVKGGDQYQGLGKKIIKGRGFSSSSQNAA